MGNAIEANLYNLTADSRLHVHTLENGLTVVLDNTSHFRHLLGAVVVKAGSRNDPPNKSGISHLLEHLLFKGTEKFGTLDYNSEKIYLDEIKRLNQLINSRDSLDETSHERLNRLYRKASQFIVENEYLTLLDSIGSTHMRAYTSREATVFQNIFPETQIEKWLLLNSERFTKPVFRNFRKEVETVINEIAYYMDKPVSQAVDSFFNHFFQPHPCSKPILGTVETVRKISMEDVERHFDSYYKADNMALILCGNFDPHRTIPLIEDAFGKLKGGVAQNSVEDEPMPSTVKPIGKKVIKTRHLPVRIGIMGYRTIGKGHADQIPLNIIKKVFYGTHASGIINKLIYQNKMILGGIETVHYRDAGGFAIYYAPKILRPFSGIEKQILYEIEKLKTGRLDNRLLVSSKTELLKERQLAMERIERRAKLLLDHFLSGNPWSNFDSYRACVHRVEDSDIAAVTNRYFSEIDSAIYSRPSFSRSSKKLNPVNHFSESDKPEKASKFARRFKAINSPKPLERYITFGNDWDDSTLNVKCIDIRPLVHLYHSHNHVNQIFSLKFRYGVGFAKAPLLLILAKYNNLRDLGSEAALKSSLALHAMGSAYSVTCNRDYFEININGFESHFRDTISLVRRLFIPDSYDDSAIKNIYRKRMLDLKFEKENPAALQKALTYYALHGEKTRFLPGISRKSMKKLTGFALKEQLDNLLQSEIDIFSAGNQSRHNLIEGLSSEYPLDRIHVKSQSPSQPVVRTIDKDTIYFMHAPGVVNARILIVIDGVADSSQDHVISTLFNAYYGNGNNSIVFKTIRVEKALAYSVGGYYTPSPTVDHRGQFVSFAEVKNQNTLDCVLALKELIEEMPVRQSLVEQAIKATQNTIAQRNTISFRQMPGLVCDWKHKGFHDDPGLIAKKLLKTASFTDIFSFYTKKIQHKSKRIIIVGNKKKMDMAGLRNVAELKVINKKKLFQG